MSGVVPCSCGCGAGGTACISSSVIPKVQRQTGAGNITVPTNTASSVTVTVITGPITVQAGADPAVSLPTGTTMTWAVESCSQKLGAALVFTGAQPGHDWLVNWTL